MTLVPQELRRRLDSRHVKNRLARYVVHDRHAVVQLLRSQRQVQMDEDLLSKPSGSVISPIGFNLDAHQSMYDVLVRPENLSNEDGAFSWAREVPVAGDGLSVRGAGSASGASWLHFASRSRGTISGRHFDAGASTPLYRTSGILGGGTSAARRAMNCSGVMTRCVRPLRFGYFTR